MQTKRPIRILVLGSRALMSLLALTCLSTPGAQTAAPVSSRAQTVPIAHTSPAAFSQTQETMPDGLMSAFLAASAQPFDAGADGYRARSGGLDFTLRAGGLQAGSNGLSLNLALSGLGRGEQIAALPEAAIAQTDSWLEYRRGALTEWYRDTALGMEQGFTIQQSPRGAGALVVRLDLDTDLKGTLDANGRGLSFAAPGGRTLRYDHLRAWDARGAIPHCPKVIWGNGRRFHLTSAPDWSPRPALRITFRLPTV